MIWKETKQQPGTAGTANMLGCCLVSFHFLWAILSTSTASDLLMIKCLPAVVCLRLEAPVEVGGEPGEALGVEVGHDDGRDVLLQRLQLGQGGAHQVAE